MLNGLTSEKLLSPARYATGWYSRRWRQQAQNHPSTIVLCYHRITPDSTAVDRLFDIERGTSASVFEAHMRFMLKYFKPIRPSEVLEPAGGNNLRFAVTFDDGYEDNYSVAAPILKKLEVSAAFYVVNEFVEGDRLFWWEQLAEILRCTKVTRCQLSSDLCEMMAMPPSGSEVDLGTWEKRDEAFQRFSLLCRRWPADRVEHFCAKLAELLGQELKHVGRAYPLMSWAQMNELADQGFEIGCHTASHPCLDGADAKTRRLEIDEAIATLQRRLTHPVKSFAYPYGYVDDAAVDSLRKTGLKLAYGGGAGAVATSAEDPFRLPRVQLSRKQGFVCAYRIQRAFNAAATAV